MNSIAIEKITKCLLYNFDEEYVFEGHSHSSWEINIILCGTMSVTYDGNVIILSEGDFFIGEPWGFHCNRQIGKNTRMAVINFEKTDAMIGKGFYVKSLTPDEFSLVQIMLGDFLENKFDKNGEVPDCEKYINAKKLCEVLVSKVMNAENTKAQNTSPRSRLYREAVLYMEQRITEKLVIEDISKALHISSAFLKNIFHEFTGTGVMSFFMGMKIRQARTMLEEGGVISVVSDSLGFSSQCYFSTVFGKIVGQTPKNYQKQYLQRNK